MKIKITDKKFINILGKNILSRQDGGEVVCVEIPRFYNNNDLSNCIFVMKTINSEGIYSENLVIKKEASQEKLFLEWVPSSTILSCEGKIGLQIIAQNEAEELVFQSFVGSAVISQSIMASDTQDVCTDTLEEYLKKIRGIYSKIEDKITLLNSQILTKDEANTMFKGKLGKTETSASAEKIEGIDEAPTESYYGTNKDGNKGFFKIPKTTSSGTGQPIGDFYEKEQVDEKLKLKSDKLMVYEKSEIDSFISTKADNSDVYKKSELDELFLKKADKGSVFTKEEEIFRLGEKADKIDVFDKENITQKLDVKADLVNGKVPTEQLPKMGELNSTETGVNCYVAVQSQGNEAYGKGSFSGGEDCVAAGNVTYAIGNNCTAATGNVFKFISYDKAENVVVIGDSEFGGSLVAIENGSEILFVSKSKKAVKSKVIIANGRNLTVSVPPQEGCMYVVVDSGTKVDCLACGQNSFAVGSRSISIGDRNQTRGDESVSVGSIIDFKGNESVAIGNRLSVEDSNSVCIGSLCVAKGGIAIGDACNSSASGAVSIGDGCYADAEGSFATGKGSETIGRFSVVGGMGGVAHYGQTVFGLNPVESTSAPNEFDVTSEAFIIGNSENNFEPGNAVKITFDSNVFAGKFNNTGADYAEYFRWSDGNDNSEDRVGYFVSPCFDCVKLSEENDFVIGAVSGNAGVIGNNPMEWQGKYEKDVFGRVKYISDKGKSSKRLKINPDWNSQEKYIPRSNRKEWACVGMLGKLIVRDNGECEVGEFCTVGSLSIAVPADENSRQSWYVTRRLEKDIIEIIFR